MLSSVRRINVPLNFLKGSLWLIDSTLWQKCMFGLFGVKMVRMYTVSKWATSPIFTLLVRDMAIITGLLGHFSLTFSLLQSFCWCSFKIISTAEFSSSPLIFSCRLLLNVTDLRLNDNECPPQACTCLNESWTVLWYARRAVPWISLICRGQRSSSTSSLNVNTQRRTASADSFFLEARFCSDLHPDIPLLFYRYARRSISS